jgi:UDP:flavonoid glycosyltransferase YjiC (YdhE family)
MLVYCGFETDMGGTTMRVVHHGLGVAGSRRRDDAETIRARIDGLLRDERVGSQVEKFRTIFEAYREQRVAETVVQSLLDRAEPENGS